MTDHKNKNLIKSIKEHRSGYNGILFNLILLLLLFATHYVFYDRTISVLKTGQSDWYVGIFLISAVLLETYLFPKRLKIILSAKQSSRIRSWAFVLIFFGVTIAFSALAIAAISFDYDPSENEYIIGIIGFFITLRFIYFILAASLGDSRFDELQALKEKVHTTESDHTHQLNKLTKMDLGIAFYSGIYYVCIWQALMLSNFDINSYKGNTGTLTLDIAAYSLLTLVGLIPIRALYFLEEIQAKPDRAGILAIILTIVLLVMETILQLLF